MIGREAFPEAKTPSTSLAQPERGGVVRLGDDHGDGPHRHGVGKRDMEDEKKLRVEKYKKAMSTV